MHICLAIAMPEELEYIKSRLEHANETNRETRGLYAGHVISLIQLGVGKVNAASALTKSLVSDQGDIDLVINTGLVGAVNPTIGPHDLFVVNRFVYHDVDATAFQYKLGTVPRMPDFYESNAVQLERLVKICETRGTTHVGTLATGDQFVSNKEKAEWIRVTFDADVVDMEGCAIAQVCHQFEKPLLSIKSVSDNADETANDEFYLSIDDKCKRSGEVVLQYIESLQLGGTHIKQYLVESFNFDLN